MKRSFALAMCAPLAGCALIASLEDHELSPPPDAATTDAAPTDVAVPIETPLTTAVVVARGQKLPRGVTTDGERIYWANEGEQTVRSISHPRAPADAGSDSGSDAGVDADAGGVDQPEGALVISAMEGIREVVVDDTRVFAFGRRTSDSCFVLGANKSNGNVLCVARDDIPLGQVWTVAHGDRVDGRLFVALDKRLKESEVFRFEASQTLLRLSLEATPSLFATTQGLSALAVGADATWVATEDGRIHRIAHAGGAPTVVASDQGVVTSIATDARGIVWVTPTSVRRLDDGSSSPVDVAPLGAGGPPSIVRVDGDEIFWTSAAEGSVRKVARGGGKPVLLVRDVPGVFGLLLENDAVTFTNSESGTVQRAAR